MHDGSLLISELLSEPVIGTSLKQLEDQWKSEDTF